MKVLSIDVGIKNLAFCLFVKSEDSDHFSIQQWDIINLSESKETSLCKECNKPAKFKKQDLCYCLKHSKKQAFQIPGPEQKLTFINKQKIQKLYEIADSHKIIYDPKCKKADLVKKINDHVSSHYFENIELNSIDSNTLIMSDVFEHFYNPIEILTKIQQSDNIKYIYA